MYDPFLYSYTFSQSKNTAPWFYLFILEIATEKRKTKISNFSINDGDDLVKYYPHGGEEIPTIKPSQVLMVKRVKTFRGEPWFNKDFCEQIGTGFLAEFLNNDKLIF